MIDDYLTAMKYFWVAIDALRSVKPLADRPDTVAFVDMALSATEDAAKLYLIQHAEGSTPAD